MRQVLDECKENTPTVSFVGGPMRCVAVSAARNAGNLRLLFCGVEAGDEVGEGECFHFRVLTCKL